MKILPVAVSIAVLAFATPTLACDQQQAVDMMVKLSTALGEKAGAAQTEEDSQKVVAANTRVNEAGEALASGDTDKACEIYRDVAAKEGISLE